MKRLDALQAIYPSSSARRRHDHGRGGRRAAVDRPRPNFFYLQHAMGLASSLGLGIALARPTQVIVLDGDGSVLMNLGGLTTLARYRPRNLLHVVFDNESLLSVGGFPTATSTGTDLAGIARRGGRAAHRHGPDARRVRAGVRRGARRERSGDDRRQGRGHRAGGVRHRPGAAGEPVPVPALSEGRGPQNVTLDSVHWVGCQFLPDELSPR